MAGEIAARMNYRSIITLASLALAGCSRYPDASGHFIRTAFIADRLAGLMEMDRPAQDHIRLSTPVHDLGKLLIPDRVLLKPGKLTPAERSIMERHSGMGADLLSTSADPLHQFAAGIARHHHERFDGGGYPDRLAGRRIPLAARIVAVVDAFDAMTETRCYRPRMADEEARAIIASGSGSHFDPEVVEVFQEGFPDLLSARATANELLSLGNDMAVIAGFYGLSRADFRSAARLVTKVVATPLHFEALV
ncbi:HD-GYP domain-containing protein [Cupriavidus pinatubonensis]|uniref:HD-GYP domain-containing protein n=1 Tax=Cupriavidus pinatubonensis TaxID=248026 RepID=UPI0036069DA5